MAGRCFYLTCLALTILFKWVDLPMRATDLRIMQELGEAAATASAATLLRALTTLLAKLAYARVPTPYVFPAVISTLLVFCLTYAAQALSPAFGSLTIFLAAKALSGLATGLLPTLQAAVIASSDEDESANRVKAIDVTEGVCNGPAAMLSAAIFAVGGVTAPYWAGAVGVALLTSLSWYTWPRAGPQEQAGESLPGQALGTPSRRPVADPVLWQFLVLTTSFWLGAYVSMVVGALKVFAFAADPGTSCEGGEEWTSVALGVVGIFGVLGTALDQIVLKPRLSPMTTPMAAAGVAALISVLLAFVEEVWQAILAMCVLGVALGIGASVSAANAAYCRREHPHALAPALSFGALGASGGATLGPLILFLSLGPGTPCELEDARLLGLSVGCGVAFLVVMAQLPPLFVAYGKAPPAPGEGEVAVAERQSSEAGHQPADGGEQQQQQVDTLAPILASADCASPASVCSGDSHGSGSSLSLPTRDASSGSVGSAVSSGARSIRHSLNKIPLDVLANLSSFDNTPGSRVHVHDAVSRRPSRTSEPEQKRPSFGLGAEAANGLAADNGARVAGLAEPTPIGQPLS